MAKIFSFKGVRPKPDLVEKVASKPYDVMNRMEAKEMANGNPHSFLRIIRPEIEFDDSVSAYDDAVYEKGKENFQAFIENGTLVKDSQESLYIYRLTMDEIVQVGIVCLCSIDDYFNEVIKKHEYTRPVKENDRIKHMNVSGIQPGPVFSAYKKNTAVDSFVESIVNSKKATNDFVASDNVRHEFWVIEDQKKIDELINLMEGVEAIYIADGHHRAATGSKVGKSMREEFGASDDAPYNGFLSVLFPHDQLKIIDYNRVVTDLNGLGSDEFLKELDTFFEVTKLDGQFEYSKNRTYGMFLDGSWYSLTLKDIYDENQDPVESLDIALLDKFVFKGLLGIEDQRTDNRIDFVGGIRGLGELADRVNEGKMKVAFAIYPVQIEELFNVADSGKVMPPKSTWFEPKLRSGMVLHQIK